MERFLVVHGQILSQLFKEYPLATISRSAFISGLRLSMASRSHSMLKVTPGTACRLPSLVMLATPAACLLL